VLTEILAIQIIHTPIIQLTVHSTEPGVARKDSDLLHHCLTITYAIRRCRTCLHLHLTGHGTFLVHQSY
jgi:hypothetical protein